MIREGSSRNRRVSLTTYRLFHASTGTMSVLLGLLHVLIHAARKPSV